jgi:putative peptidoglycan lipid II flippase
VTATAGATASETSHRGAERSVAVDARPVALWTLASRFSGFVRVAVLAAVLGPTFFGNLFQTALLVPYVIAELLAGSFVPALLAPRIVRFLAAGDEAAANRLASGFLVVTAVLFGAVALATALAAPVLAWLITAAVPDPAVREQQLALAIPLIIALAPQIVLDGVAAVGIAGQYARRRFAFATAAPIVKNLGLILTLGLAAGMFGPGRDIFEVSLGEVLFLAVGATVASGAHAAAQMIGAWRAGMRFAGIGGWRDSEVRRTLPMAFAASGTAGLSAVAWLALLTAAGSIPGGAVAFQIAWHLGDLPTALFAKPIATAQMPRLVSHHLGADGHEHAFGATYRDSLRLVLFIALPVSLLFVAAPGTLAAAIAFGGMAKADAIGLIATCLAGFAAGIIGEALFAVSASAAYARLDAGSPFHAMAIRLVVVAAGIALVLGVQPGDALFGLAGTGAAASWAGAAYLVWRMSSRRVGTGGLGWLTLNVATSVLAVAPAAFIARSLPAPRDPAAGLALFAALALVTAALYAALQYARRSAELAALLPLADRMTPR